MSLQYAQVQPETLKDSYGEYDTVDFVLTFEGRKLLLNNIRLVGDIAVNSTGTTRVTPANDIYMDNMIGIHSVVEGISTDFQTRKNVEQFNEYARYYSMLMKSSNSCDDMFNGSQLCELKTAESVLTRNILAGVNNEDVDFSFKPHFVLNNAISADGQQPTLSYKESGAVRISVRLARNLAVLYGSDVSATSNYAIKNLRLHYLTIPEDNQKQQLTMKTKIHIKQTVQSKFANLSSKVPAITNACSISFQNQTKEYTALDNEYALEKPPMIREVQFLFNDNQMNFITYKLEDVNEITERYLESFGSTDNSLTPARLASNRAYGVGINFGELGYVNLANQKFNVQLQSEISSANPFNVYMYFHSIIEL